MSWSYEHLWGWRSLVMAIMLGMIGACQSPRASSVAYCEHPEQMIRPVRIRSLHTGSGIDIWILDDAVDYLNMISGAGPAIRVTGRARTEPIVWQLDDTEQLLEALRALRRFDIDYSCGESRVRLKDGFD